LAFGALNGVRMTVIPSVRKTSSNAALNFASRSWIRKRVGRSRPPTVDHEVARLLSRPHAVRVVGATSKPDPPALQLDEEQHVEAPQ
jgi:hypothetical protein